jgi:TolB-like protein
MKEARRTIVCGWLAALAAAALPAACFAQAQATDLPAGPMRQPALFAAPGPRVAIRPADKILLLPFEPLNPGDTQAWIGKSVQQSLLSDLLSAAPHRIVSGDAPAAATEQALAAAKKAGAGYVVTGSFLTTKDLIRISGQVIDVVDGQPICGLMVTGVPLEIFRMEDSLAMQVKATLMPDVLAQEQAAQQQFAQQPNSQPTTAEQPAGVRTDVGAATPTSTYYSIYAYPAANNNYIADTERYYYSYPSTIYTYNTFSDYGMPIYGSGLFALPYCYTSPFVGVGIGLGRGGYHHVGVWGRDWHTGHAWRPGWEHHDHHVAGAFNFQPDPGITNSTQINYAGIVSGNLTNIGANRAIVPNRTSYAQRPLAFSTAAPVSASIPDPAGSLRAHGMILTSGSNATANSRTRLSYHSFDPGSTQEMNSRGQIIIRGRSARPGNGGVTVYDGGQAVPTSGQQAVRSLPASSGGVMSSAPPPPSAGPAVVPMSAPPPPPPTASAPPPSSSGGGGSGSSASRGNSNAARGNGGSAGSIHRGGR